MANDVLIQKYNDYSEKYEQITSLLAKILEQGEIKQEDKQDLQEGYEDYTESASDVKNLLDNIKNEKFNEVIKDLKNNMVGASVDEILNILTENGRKCWLYKDDDNNVLVDGTSIPKLTILAKELEVIANKLSLIATDGEDETQLNLTSKFIEMIAGEVNAQSITIQYYLSTSNSKCIGGSWVDTLPTTTEQEGKYLWYKLITTDNDTTTETSPILITNGSTDGKDGVSVTSLIVEYSSNTSTTTAPTTGWSTNMPSYQEGYFLWQRIGVKFGNSDTYSYNTPTCDQSWKASSEVHSEYKQLKDKFTWLITDGSTSTSLTITDQLIQAIANSNIELSAKKILINGLLEGTGWKIDEEGNLDINDLNIKGNLTCNTMNINNLVSANIPVALNEHKNITINEGESINEALEDVPLNLNGYSLNIWLATDVTENLELRRHENGNVNIYLGGYTLKGYIKTNFNNCIYNLYGGNSDSDDIIGSIMPGTGNKIGSYYFSLSFVESQNVNIRNIKVYGDNSTNSAGIGATRKSQVDMENVQFVGCKYNCISQSMAEVYCRSSSGKSTAHSWWAMSASEITLYPTSQAGGSDNTHESSNGQVISTGVTFGTTANTGTNTNTDTTTTTNKVMTIKPVYADTYRSTVYNNWKKDGVARQGNWNYGNCNGCFFYGSQFEELEGKEITKVVLLLYRNSNAGYSASTSHTIKAHNYASRPSGSPSYTNCGVTISLGWGESGNVTITNSTILTGIANGTIKGFGIQSAYDASHYSSVSNGTVKIYYKE